MNIAGAHTLRRNDKRRNIFRKKREPNKEMLRETILENRSAVESINLGSFL